MKIQCILHKYVILSNSLKISYGDGCLAFPQKPDNIIDLKVEFCEGEVTFDNIAKRGEAYKPKGY